jgi:hypothetical protein
MLRQDDGTVTAGETAGEVRIPAEWDDFFAYRGRVKTSSREQRQHPRFYLRTKAVLHIAATIGARPVLYNQGVIYIKDISRSGMSFLHVEQLFPMDQVCIQLENGQSLAVQVNRCRKLATQCYEVGGQFKKGQLLSETDSPRD